MVSKPVSPERIKIAADSGLQNAETIAAACREAEVPFYVACALMEKESNGVNLWGNDAGGLFAELPSSLTVTKGAFEVFEFYVVELGHTSNGVGPAQITWKGFFPDMRKKGLRAWVPLHNMIYGFQLLHDYKNVSGATWEDAGTHYNGERSYGVDFAAKVHEWRKRLHE